jgi:hypothetical protein
VVRPPNDRAAGYDATFMSLGPLMLVQQADPPPVSEIAPAQAASLCGRWLDWIEIVR